MREPDPAVFDRDALDEREGKLPVQPEPSGVEGEHAGRGQHDDVVRAGDVCILRFEIVGADDGVIRNDYI